MSPRAKREEGPERTVTDARTMRALAHPVRLALLEALVQGGPLTATKAAELLDDTPGNMSWHLQTLAKYGFVEEDEGGRGRSRPWRVVSRKHRFDTALSDPDTAAAGEALEATFHERNLQRLREWWVRRRSYSLKWRQAAFSSDVFTYLTATEMERLAVDIHHLLDKYRDRAHNPSARPRGAEPIHIVTYGHPLPPIGDG